MPDAIEIEEISKLKIQLNYIFNTVIFKFWILVLPFETRWCWWRILKPKVRDLNSVTNLCYLSQILSHHWWLTNICTGKNIFKLTITFWNKKTANFTWVWSISSLDWILNKNLCNFILFAIFLPQKQCKINRSTGILYSKTALDFLRDRNLL